MPMRLQAHTVDAGTASTPARAGGIRARRVHVPLAVVLAALLAACAAATSDATASGPLAGTFRYTRSEGAFLLGGSGRFEVLVPQSREIWVASDGSGRLRVTYGAPEFFGTHDRAEWKDEHTERVEDKTYSDGLAFTDLAGVPTDPDKLRAEIVSKIDRSDTGRGSEGWEVFVAARGYLWETVPPVELSRAILAILQRTDGIEIRKRARDRMERPAIALSVVGAKGGVRDTLFLDPDTGALLAEQQDLLKPVDSIDAAPPVTIKYVTYRESKIVRSTNEQ